MLQRLPRNRDPNLLVGFDTLDDAGVYRLTDDIALITTADYITPPVNDPYQFGQIAAANAISDIYAMGGRPVTCINLVSFPSRKLDPEVLHQIVAGALDKITEAGAVLAGGHSIEDEEPKFGLAVTGIVHPQKFWTNAGAQPGDVILLTKPLGSGVLFNANLKGWVSSGAMADCIKSISALNRRAAEVLQDFSVHAATDVTGFGLAGHGYEMAQASNVQLAMQMSALPLHTEALDMYRKGMRTGVNRHNRDMVGPQLRFDVQLPDWHQEIVFDPQTSGGLLVTVPEEQAPTILQRLHQAGVEDAVVIGRVNALSNGRHIVLQ